MGGKGVTLTAALCYAGLCVPAGGVTCRPWVKFELSAKFTFPIAKLHRHPHSGGANPGSWGEWSGRGGGGGSGDGGGGGRRFYRNEA